MNIARSGIILNTEHYDECVEFYRSLFGLPILFQQQDGDFRLTCFEFEGAYLMIETDGFAKPEGKSIHENSSKLRFNVPDIELALQTVRNFGIEAEVNHYNWGKTIDLYDPDGNRVGIRDEPGFLQQIRNREH